jgi:hypothetical protein
MDVEQLQHGVTEIVKSNMQILEIPMKEIADQIATWCADLELSPEEVDTVMNFAGWTVNHYTQFYWAIAKLKNITKASRENNISDKLDID